ncbi:head-to-tail adaptor [Mycobacterium phage Avani]|uniref:Head-to-tail adaptor n=4 Tax=Avanivirus TaxID=2843352 RepID=G1BSN2_9CAUD|nr:head-tail adaptor [Mycobacterium phage Jabbawokkie]YP_009013104.1 head-tail adaptor [Mycobacterium phage Avani]YP_009613913.1 head-tail adaptor [Mycobacterium phage Yoshi]YP_009963824.1 head-tail adaptor [Mycobacterium phage Soul22]YP_009963927.1 head-tail adaptor [Mycobacterium phage Zapner]QXG07379.1 head to tail connector protein [Mycobacterium phage RitSun]AEK07760.1 head-to-tail adaptor [Mycobacterium phage Yoshi]AFL47923.1 head-to-tail adaptor [Mycobacterium phage Avani]AGT12109.1 
MTEIIKAADLPDDIAANAMAAVWVDGANARASRVAPCLAADPTDDQLAEAKLILIGAVMRWSQAGSGALQSQTMGPYGVTFDTRQRGGFNLWPSEITQLQDICKNGAESKAFAVDTVACGNYHSPICSVYFGGTCSCGAVLAGQPIYEQEP